MKRKKNGVLTVRSKIVWRLIFLDFSDLTRTVEGSMSLSSEMKMAFSSMWSGYTRPRTRVGSSLCLTTW